jgi:MoaA/NifB/PqqE/SkfB family radical SAM enzyme
LLTNGQRLASPDYLSSLDQSGLDHILITLDPGNLESGKGLDAALATEIFTAVHLIINDASAITDLDQLANKGVTAVSLTARTADTVDSLQNARDHAAYLGLDLIWDLPVPYSSRNPISLELESQLQGDGRTWIYVEPDGDVLPAQGIDAILGNMLRDPWDQIWMQAQAWYAKQFPLK